MGFFNKKKKTNKDGFVDLTNHSKNQEFQRKQREQAQKRIRQSTGYIWIQQFRHAEGLFFPVRL